MNKKRIVILAIICILIIPITVFATMRVRIAVDKVLTKKEFNEQRKQEKENWINTQKTNKVSNVISDNKSTDEKTIDKYSRRENEVNNNRKEMDRIINRFYADKYKRILTNIAENSNKMSISELYQQKYAEELFDLIIDIIENKNITVEEKNILKKFLDEQLAFIKENSEMKMKFNRVLKDYKK